jgi:RNA recognition motif-containing protein
MKVYVGNLPYSVDDAKLRELFETYGEVEEATVIQNKFSGRSKGFGFVTFKEEHAAKKAIEEMNEKTVDGRQINVKEAQPFDPDRPRPPRRDFGGGGRGGGDRGFNRRRDY